MAPKQLLTERPSSVVFGRSVTAGLPSRFGINFLTVRHWWLDIDLHNAYSSLPGGKVFSRRRQPVVDSPGGRT